MEDRTLCVQHAERLGKIQDDVSEIRASTARIDTTLEFQQEILKNHIARTQINEDRLDKLDIPYKIVSFIVAPMGVIASIATILHYLGVF